MKKEKSELNLTKELKRSILQMRAELLPIVLRRDNNCCIICQSKQFLDCHEILPRSRFGKLNMQDCFVLKNMATLCRRCHDQSHSFQSRVQLLNILKNKFNYSYNEQHFNQYLRNH